MAVQILFNVAISNRPYPFSYRDKADTDVLAFNANCESDNPLPRRNFLRVAER